MCKYFCLYNVKIFLNIITACPLELVGETLEIVDSKMPRLQPDSSQRLKCLIIIVKIAVEIEIEIS